MKNIGKLEFISNEQINTTVAKHNMSQWWDNIQIPYPHISTASRFCWYSESHIICTTKQWMHCGIVNNSSGHTDIKGGINCLLEQRYSLQHTYIPDMIKVSQILKNHFWVNHKIQNMVSLIMLIFISANFYFVYYIDHIFNLLYRPVFCDM